MIDLKHPDFENHPASDRRPDPEYKPADPATTPVVSVVTPFHNTRPEVLAETALSLHRQTLQAWEWIIVNDLSSDEDCVKGLERYRSLDPRIRVIDLETNRGPGGARNGGHLQAKAPYVFHLDDDDLIEPTTLEKLAWFLETNPKLDLACGWSVAFGGQQYLWSRGFEPNDEILKNNIVPGRVMIRRDAYQDVGGFDEDIRGGFEDWDLWLKFAEQGRWGATIPEYLDWYRRREDHSDRWPTWDDAARQNDFAAALPERFPTIYKNGIPKLAADLGPGMPFGKVPFELPFDNPIEKNAPRLLLVVPWLDMGGSDKFNLDLIEQLTQRGWQITIVTTLPDNMGWAPEFAKYTTDIFSMSSFLKPADFPRFVDYLMTSRSPDVVCMTHSKTGYLLLPFLRSRHPGVTFVDYNHIEELSWESGGYPRFGAGFQALLDLNIVSSNHLKDWMAERGADPDRIEVCYTNAKPREPKTDDRRKQLAEELDIEEGTPVVLFAGRLHEQKQPAVLTGVVRGLVELEANFVIVIAGDGPDRPMIDELVNDPRVAPHVRYLGKVPNRRVIELLELADLFFLPSLWEGIALSVYEAMASSVAVLGAAVGGQRELVDETCGILIEPSSPKRETEQYIEHFDRLLADPKRLREMGAAGRERIATKFHLDDMGDNMIKAFDRAKRLHPAVGEAGADNVPEGYAEESARLAIELLRVTHVADSLWDRVHNAGGSGGVTAGLREVSAVNAIQFLNGSHLFNLLRFLGDGGRPAPNLSPQEQLDRLKSSNAYRVYNWVRCNSLYRVFIRLRHGKDAI